MTDDIAIIDIEASGLHFDSYPIEVAVLVANKSQSWLIKPEASWQHWCETAEGLHGLSRSTLEDNGLPVQRVVNELNTFLNEWDYPTLYSDALPWDTDWIDTLYFAANEARPFHMASIFDLLNEREKDAFSALKAQMAISSKYRQHCAHDDVQIIMESLRGIKKDLTVKKILI